MTSYDPLPAVNKAFDGFLSFARVIERLNASANLVRQPDGLHEPVSTNVSIPLKYRTALIMLSDKALLTYVKSRLAVQLEQSDPATVGQFHVTEVVVPSRTRRGYITFVKVHHPA